MSNTTDMSVKLGEYMLKGWVLTDRSCPNPRCNIPLMRSPTGVAQATYFCAGCDVLNNRPVPQPLDVISSPSISSGSRVSRSSTPATQVSSTPSSPTFTSPAETEENIRRRQQSDAASQEIGKRLLKGWTLLANECSNGQCYGVPLVGPPKALGVKDPRMECVICGTFYVHKADSASHLTFGGDGKAFTCEERLLDSEFLPLCSDIGALTPSIAPLQTLSSSPEIKSTPLVAASAPSSLAATAVSLEMALRALSERLQSLSRQTTLDPALISVTADAICKVAQALNLTKQA